MSLKNILKIVSRYYNYSKKNKFPQLTHSVCHYVSKEETFREQYLEKKKDFALIFVLMMFYNGNLHEKIFEYAKKKYSFWTIPEAANFIFLCNVSYRSEPKFFFVDSNINLMWKWYGRVKISNFLVLGVTGTQNSPLLAKKWLFWAQNFIYFFRKFIPKLDVWYQNQPSIICRCQDMVIQKLEVCQKRQNLKCP